MNRVLILFSILFLLVAWQPAEAQTRGIHLEVTIGAEEIESVDALFRGIDYLPQTTLDWIAPASSITVAVDDETPMRVVEDTRRALRGGGIEWIRFEPSERVLDPDARLEVSGRLTVSLGAPGISDLSGELEPVLRELLPSSIVLLQIADGAPARLFMGVQEALRDLGATYTRMY